MAIIVWKEEFSIGIPKFDDQHKELFKLLDGILQSMASGQGDSKLGELITGLERYTISHFKEEENFLRTNNYPELEEHIAKHAFYISKIANFKSDYAKHKVGLSLDIVDFLKKWLEKHIKVSDKEYSLFIQEKGKLS